MTLGELLRSTGAALAAGGVDNAGQESRWLVLARPGLARAAAVADFARCVPAAQVVAVRRQVQRRCAGEPLAYVLGTAEFRGLSLAVGPGVLIPRPETERLVDFALEHYPGRGAVCDLCTGAGAVALALAAELPRGTPVMATDLSRPALAFARRNRDRLRARTVRLLHGDLFAPVPARARFALVTANPPYVSPAAFAALPAEVRDWEPRLALWADDAGLALVRRIAAESRPRLTPGGWVVCEISSEQGAAARRLFAAHGYSTIEVRQDYTGRDRVVCAQR